MRGPLHFRSECRLLAQSVLRSSGRQVANLALGSESRSVNGFKGGVNVLKRLAAVCLSVLLIAGCGGGGDDGPVASTETFDLKSAWANYVSSASSRPFSISGMVAGESVSGSGTITEGALLPATFEGLPALSKTTIASATITVAGQSIPLSTSSSTYVDSTYLPLGSSGERYSVVTGVPSIPSSARVNDTGLIYTEINYPNSAKAYSIGTTTLSFALEPDTASTALVKLVAVDKDTAGTTIATSVTTLRVTPTGGLTWISDSTTSMDGTLTFTY